MGWKKWPLVFLQSLDLQEYLHYIIKKIWFTSVWRQKPKAVAWFLTCVMVAQSTLISYHTDCLVQTEIATTAPSLFFIFFPCFGNSSCFHKPYYVRNTHWHRRCVSNCPPIFWKSAKKIAALPTHFDVVSYTPDT